PIINILRDEREGPYNGAYSFLFETEDGTTRQESGSPVGPDGSVVQQGSWSFSFPDGSPGQFNFIADHNGYQVDSSLVPTPHPLPAHAVAQIEKAERERAAGIFHDGQYREGFTGSFGGSSGFGGSGSSGSFGGVSSGSRGSSGSFGGVSSGNRGSSGSFGGSSSFGIGGDSGSFGGSSSFGSGGGSFGSSFGSSGGQGSFRSESRNFDSSKKSYGN
ncbi:UNVERIFIED_CONTAM: hypothetical protein GTU68_019066, partial [Idotea baltica]|nr:hypothetical protein [Idotea baltica]